MKLQKSKTANVNYLSKIVQVNSFNPHPNPEYTKLKVAHVDGFNLIVSIDMQPGLYVYFPAMSQLNPDLLSYLSLYRDATKNRNTEKGSTNWPHITSRYSRCWVRTLSVKAC